MSGTKLVLAREHGLPGWARLKMWVEGRRVGPVIRPVASPEELALAFDVVMAQMVRPASHVDRRFSDVAGLGRAASTCVAPTAPDSTRWSAARCQTMCRDRGCGARESPASMREVGGAPGSEKNVRSTLL